LLACHDFKYIDLKPDRHNVSCHAHYTMKRCAGMWTTSKLAISMTVVGSD
jgi:hypothetical protein